MGTIYSIPVDCVFQRSNEEIPEISGNSGKYRKSRHRRDAVATADSHFEIKLEYMDDQFKGALPTDKRLIGKLFIIIAKEPPSFSSK